MRHLVRKRRKTLILQFQLEIIGLHAGVVEGMPALIEHHEHNDRTRPQIHRFRIGRLIEYLRCHVQQRPALRLDINRVMYLQFGGQSEIDDFDGREVFGVLEQYVFYLIMEILACF